MSETPFLGFGVGLRPQHYVEIESGPRRVDWLEAITENYMDTRGRPLAVLERIRSDYPLALHGVALSIGSAEPLDVRYLEGLRQLVTRIDPALVTDHLCWTGIKNRKVYDLLPVLYTNDSLDLVADKVARVQEILGRTIALENPSRYLAYRDADIEEHEFLTALARRTGCGLLLDVNNVYVSAKNLGFDAEAYIDAIPAESIAQVHLAGFSDLGTHLFDTHSAPVAEEVWSLYRRLVRRTGPLSTLVEWDTDIPSFERVCAEADKARAVVEDRHAAA